ncbi:hypothetical protein D3C71_1460830 [compost metagenome]
MAGWVRKQGDDLFITKITVRPSMGKNDGKRIGPFTTLMYEVYVYAVDIAAKLG